MKVKAMMVVVAAFSLLACNQMDLPINQETVFPEDQKASLDIKVKATPTTKANGYQEPGIITGNGLPKGSEIGVFLTDDSGVTYDGISYDNIRYRNEESDELGSVLSLFQDNWRSWGETPNLSATKGTLYSYYPYSDNTDITKIPVGAGTGLNINIDFMYGTPVTALDYNNKEAVITMNHDLAIVRLNIDKGNFDSDGNISHVHITTEGAAGFGLLNAKDGSLSSFQLIGQQFDNFDELNIAEAPKVEFMVVPTGTSAPISIGLVLNDIKYAGELPAVALESGKIYEYTVSVRKEKLVMQTITIEDWDTVSTEELYGYESFSIFPMVDFNTYIPKIISSYEEPGMALIIDKNDYIYYSPEEWIAAEEAGIVTDADACGVLVTNSSFFLCYHIIHPKKSPTTLSWSSSQSPIPEVKSYETTIELLSPYFKKAFPELDIENLLLGKLEIQEIQKILEFLELPDMESFLPVLQQLSTMVFAAELNGKNNTEAILAAVADGTIPDAPAAEYCANVTFANGKQGYLPSSGQILAWFEIKDAINAALLAIGGDPLAEDEIYWSSTQITQEYNGNSAICFKSSDSDQTLISYDKRSHTEVYARPVTNMTLF